MNSGARSTKLQVDVHFSFRGVEVSLKKTRITLRKILTFIVSVLKILASNNARKQLQTYSNVRPESSANCPIVRRSSDV
jgi:hypothetical protein